VSTFGHLVAALIGYLLGSVTFAHLLARVAKRPAGANGSTLKVPHNDARLESTSGSATAVRMRDGVASGCLVGILDMAKGALPAFLLRLSYPNAYCCWSSRGWLRSARSGPVTTASVAGAGSL
jgi:glycerol-3-phosphate acyltransferase PlsY